MHVVKLAKKMLRVPMHRTAQVLGRGLVLGRGAGYAVHRADLRTAPLSSSTSSSRAGTASPATGSSSTPSLHFPSMQPFHIAVPVHDLSAARAFYGELLGCAEGRSSKTWIDWNLGGHQLVTHFASTTYRALDYVNEVDTDMVPVPHFGICLSTPQFHAIADKLVRAGVKFIVEPHLRFPGKPGEQWTMFFKDPSGNNLEMKALTNPANLFAKYYVD